MSPQEQEEFIRQKTEIVNEYKKQQEQIISEQYQLTDEKNIELEKQRIRMQIKSSERMARLDQIKSKNQENSKHKDQSDQNFNGNEQKTQQYKQLFQQTKSKNQSEGQRNVSRGGQRNFLQQIDASESQYLTNNEHSISPNSTFYKNAPNDEKTHSFFKNNNQNSAVIRQYNGVLSQENDDSDSPKKAEEFGKIEQYVYKPARSRSVSPTKDLNETINQSPDNSTKLNKSYIVKQRNGTNNSFLSKGKYSLFQQNNSNNQPPNSNLYLLEDQSHNQNVSFPAKSSIQNQGDDAQLNTQTPKSQKKQKSQERVPQSLLNISQQGQINQEKAPIINYQYKSAQNFNFDQQQRQNDFVQSGKTSMAQQQKLDPMSISLSKNQKERNDQQSQNIKDDIIKDNQKSEKDLNDIQEDTKENISTIHNNNSGINGGNTSPYFQKLRSGSIVELRYQQEQTVTNQQKDPSKNNQNPLQQMNIQKDKNNNVSSTRNAVNEQNQNFTSQQNQINMNMDQSQKVQNAQFEQRQDQTTIHNQQTQNKYKEKDLFKSEQQVSNLSNSFSLKIFNSQQDFTVQNKYDTQKEIFNSLFQLSHLDSPFQSNIKLKVYNLQNSNPIDLDWEFKSMLENQSPICPKLYQGNTYIKDQETNQINIRQSTYLSYNYNASNLCKEYFKDIHLLYQINKEFRQNRENTPSPILLSLPVCFEISKNQLEVICETSRFQSMTEMIKRRKNQSGQLYSENELAFVFHSILKSIEVFEKKGILHSYLTTDNLIYCIESCSYKLLNYSLSQTFNTTDFSKNQRAYNIYYQQPYIQNEQKSQQNIKQTQFTPFFADRYALAVSFFCIQQLIEPTDINQNIITRAINLMDQKKDNSSVSNKVILHLLKYSKQQQQQSDIIDFNQFWSQIFNTLDSVQHIQPEDEQLAIMSYQNQDNFAENKEFRSESMIKQLADQSYTTFQFSRSLDLYLKLFEMQEKKYGKNDERRIPTLNKIWKIYFSNNDFEKSYFYCKQYTELAKQNYENQRNLHLQQSKKTQITQIDSQLNTEQMSAFNKLQRNLVTDFNLSGQLKWQLEKKEEAINDYEMALQLQIEIYGENEYNVIKNINNIGVYYSNINQMDKAIEIIKSAVLKMEQQNISDQLYTSALYNLGNLLSDNGQLQEALPYLTKSYEIKKKTLGNNQEVGRLAHLIGTLHFQLKSYQQSLSFLDEAVSILQKFSESDDQEYIKYKRNYIVSLVKNNQHQQANQQIESILSAFSQSNFQSYTETPAQIYYELGNFLEKILKFDYALASYKQSVQQSKANSVQDNDQTLGACLKRINSLQSKIGIQQKQESNSKNQQEQKEVIQDKVQQNSQNKQQDQLNNQQENTNNNQNINGSSNNNQPKLQDKNQSDLKPQPTKNETNSQGTNNIIINNSNQNQKEIKTSNNNSNQKIQSFSNATFDDNKGIQQQQNLQSLLDQNSRDLNMNNQNLSIPYQLKGSSNTNQKQNQPKISAETTQKNEDKIQGNQQTVNQEQNNQIKTDQNKDLNQGNNNQKSNS